MPPYEPEYSGAVYHLYVIRVPDRDRLVSHLKAAGIHTGLHYPIPLHMQRCYAAWGLPPRSLPVTHRVASEIVSLPMFPGLTSASQRRVVDAIEAFVAAGRSA